MGQGDPLLGAAMKRWPCTTVNAKEEPKPQVVATRALSLIPCRTLVDPSVGKLVWSTNDILHMDNVGHVETAPSADPGERRFILLSEDRRFIVVHPTMLVETVQSDDELDLDVEEEEKPTMPVETVQSDDELDLDDVGI